jgi:hypothetical protein
MSLHLSRIDVISVPLASDCTQMPIDQARQQLSHCVTSLTLLGSSCKAEPQERSQALLTLGIAAYTCLLTNSALVEKSLGQWDQALDHLQQAHDFGLRGVLSTSSSHLPALDAQVLETLHALVLAPRNLEVVQTQSMIYLA